MDRATVFNKLDKVSDLPTLPAIAMEVNRMLNDDKVTIDSLSKTIEKDQAIVSKLLRLVNSAFFGLRSKVGSTHEAVVLLGFNTIRNVVLAVSVINAFSGKGKMENFDVVGFWKHSIGVAMIAKAVSENTKTAGQDESFLAGILHDMGKIIQLQFFPDMFKAVVVTAAENGISFYEAEKKDKITDHAKIGGYLAKKWQLPASLTDTITRHHSMDGSSNSDLIINVHTANILANAFLPKEKKPKMLSEIHPDALRKIKPTISTINDWLPQTIEEIESACEFFMEADIEK